MTVAQWLGVGAVVIGWLQAEGSIPVGNIHSLEIYIGDVGSSPGGDIYTKAVFRQWF